MKGKLNILNNVVITFIFALLLFLFSAESFAASVYTKNLNVGDKLKLTSDNWNYYSSLELAQKADSKKAAGTLKKGKTFEILEINSNVLKIAKNKYIYYGSTASNSFKRVSVAVNKVKLNETELTLKVGEKFKLIPTINNETKAYKDVKWESSNKVKEKQL